MIAIVHEVDLRLRTLQYNYHLDLSRWEDDAVPGQRRFGPQGRIDDALQIEDADIVVGVFWKRLGTPTADARSGSEHKAKKPSTPGRQRGRPRSSYISAGRQATLAPQRKLSRCSGWLSLGQKVGNRQSP